MPNVVMNAKLISQVVSVSALLLLSNVCSASVLSAVTEMAEKAAAERAAARAVKATVEEASVAAARDAAKTAAAAALVLAAPRTAASDSATVLTIFQDKLFAVDGAGQTQLIATAEEGHDFVFTDTSAILVDKTPHIVKEGDLPRIRTVIRAMLDGTPREVKVLRSDGTVHRLILVDGTGDRALLLEHSPGIWIDLDDERYISVDWMLAQRFDHSAVRVVSFFEHSDNDVLRALDDAVGEAHISTADDSHPDSVKFLGRLKRKTLFLVGHVEGEAFVVRNPAGVSVRRIPFADIQDAARSADSTVLL